MSAAALPGEAPRVFVFELEMPIRWGDMDAMGHVNNTVYFRYMEQLRIAWFDAMGFQRDPGGEGLVVVETGCSFRRELRYPGTVLLRQHVDEIGRSSLRTYVELSRTDDPQTLYASGTATLVWVDHRQKRSVAWPDTMRRALTEPCLRR
ncbi:MAG: acyl-CoA thioesterase [Burkholderiaceae bacterium]